MFLAVFQIAKHGDPNSARLSRFYQSVFNASALDYTIRRIHVDAFRWGYNGLNLGVLCSFAYPRRGKGVCRSLIAMAIHWVNYQREHFGHSRWLAQGNPYIGRRRAEMHTLSCREMICTAEPAAITYRARPLTRARVSRVALCLLQLNHPRRNDNRLFARPHVFSAISQLITHQQANSRSSK